MLCKRWRNTNDELVPGSFIFDPVFRDKKIPVENETWSNAEMDWDNEQICHWLTAVGLGEYVQVFRGMFVKLGIKGSKIKEPGTSSSFVFLHLLHNISFGR
jgi:hypothetical protein